MEVNKYVRWIFDEPEMSDDCISAVVGGCTGWPSFFRGDPIRIFTKQLYHAKRALARGFTIDQIFEGKDREVGHGKQI